MKLFPTPTTRDYKDGSAERIRDGVVQDDTVARAVFEAIRGGEILMPTPKALDGVKGNLKSSQERIDSGNQVDLPNVAIDLLPTTTASDWKGANNSGSGSASANMLAAKIDLLPTTTTNGNERKGPGYSSAGILQELEIANGILPKEYLDWDHAAQKVSSIPEQKSEKMSLDEMITWGKFEPAIRRWETVLGRPAPAPTKPDGKDGAHRLSSKFTEWMMGLPDGWVTDCGLTRNEELKACGNGVVPQQAELALRILLEGIELEPLGGGQVMLPTPTVSDIYTDNLASTQQKPGSMHSVTLPQAVRMIDD